MENASQFSLQNDTNLFSKKEDWWLVIFYLALYITVYNTLIFRFGLGLEDLSLDTKAPQWWWPAIGRWGCWFFRAFIGAGSCYPASCIASAIFLALATVIQTRILNLKHLFAKLLYVAGTFVCFQWSIRLPSAIDCDSIAFSLLSCSLSVYCLQFKSTKNTIYSILFLCLGLSGYQSCVLYYFSLLLLFYLSKIEKSESYHLSFIGRCALITFCGIGSYFLIDQICKLFVPPSVQSMLSSYLEDMTGWQDVFKCNTFKDFLQLFYSQVFSPICHDVLGQRGGDLARPYVLIWIPFLIYLKNQWKRYSKMKFCILIFILISLIFLPFLTTLLLFSEKANVSRIWLALPIVFSSLWALAYRNYQFNSHKINTVICVIVSFFLFKAMYHCSIQARDEAYYVDRAIDELREMNVMARIEEKKGGFDAQRFLICGTLRQESAGIYSRSRILGTCNGKPLTVLYGEKGVFSKECIKLYGAYFRLARFHIATEKEEKDCSVVLKEMPCWPKQGSVRAYNGNILIKIAESQHSEP